MAASQYLLVHVDGRQELVTDAERVTLLEVLGGEYEVNCQFHIDGKKATLFMKERAEGLPLNTTVNRALAESAKGQISNQQYLNFWGGFCLRGPIVIKTKKRIVGKQFLLC